MNTSNASVDTFSTGYSSTLTTPGPPTVFDISELGNSCYVITLLYLIMALWATFKMLKVNQLVSDWASQKIFHLFLVIFVFIRAISFGALTVLDIKKAKYETTTGNEIWYPLEVILFSLPEFCMISTYVLLFFHWMETYLFTHEQFLVLSKARFRKNWRIGFAILTFISYATLLALYAVLCFKADNLIATSPTTWAINLATSVANFAIPFLFLVVYFYLACILLSGFPLRQSALARAKLRKLTRVLLVWTFGRLVRGTMILIDTQHYTSWKLILGTSESYIFPIIVITTLVISECLPVFVILEWSVLGLLLVGNGTTDDSSLYSSITDTYKTLQRNHSANDSISSGASFQDGYGSRLESEILNDKARLMEMWTIAFEHIRLDTGVPFRDEGIFFTTKGWWAGRQVCVKAFHLEGVVGGNVTSELIGELCQASAMVDEHIVAFLGVSMQKQTVYVLSEYMERRSLFDTLGQLQNPITLTIVLRMALQIALGLQQIHEYGVCHGHLNSRNVLLDANMNCKVGDVGTKGLKAYCEVMMGRQLATPWSSPETMDMGHTDHSSSDIYSYGIILWELITRRVPFEGKSMSSVKQSVISGERLPLPEDTNDSTLPRGLVHLIKKCWNVDPRARPRISAIIKELDELRTQKHTR